jgi:hypothetical protein
LQIWRGASSLWARHIARGQPLLHAGLQGGAILNGLRLHAADTEADAEDGNQPAPPCGGQECAHDHTTPASGGGMERAQVKALHDFAL